MVLAVVTLLLVGSLKMDSCQAKKGHAKFMKMQQRSSHSTQRPSRLDPSTGGAYRNEDARKGRGAKRGSRGDRGEGAWKKREKKIN